MTNPTIYERLSRIQKELKAPKDSKNTFGNYSYRNAEQILQNVKALLQDGERVMCTDDMRIIGDRYYIEAQASFGFGTESVVCSGFAREQEDKKGMDHAQVTGACSSYARKYALSGLFAIDDSKDDPDTKDNSEEGKPKAQESPEKYDNAPFKAAKAFQSDMVNKISLCKSVDELDVLLNNNSDKLDRLKEAYPDLYESVEYQENSVRDGGPIKNPVLKFVNVLEAENFAKSCMEMLDVDLNITEMQLFENDNMPYLIGKDGQKSALDKALSAAKYQKEGKTPSDRIIEKFKFKLTALHSTQG